MNILVLGGTRFLGKHLVRELLAKGHQVTIATRGLTRDDFGDRVARLKLERTDLCSLRENLPGCRYDVVFDSLAYCSNDVARLLDTVRCNRYVQVSSVSVYENLCLNTVEEDFDAGKKPLLACERDDFSYGEIKRQAECAIVQSYPQVPSVRVRFPYVTGTDDYTDRLYFYVEHIVGQKPMLVNNPDSRTAFVRSDEAGKFLAFLGESDFTGAVNGASRQTVTLREIGDYVQAKTGKAPVYSDTGDPGPYNGGEDFSLDVSKAETLGFAFTPLPDWIYGLLDSYILRAETEKTLLSGSKNKD